MLAGVIGDTANHNQQLELGDLLADVWASNMLAVSAQSHHSIRLAAADAYDDWPSDTALVAGKVTSTASIF